MENKETERAIFDPEEELRKIKAKEEAEKREALERFKEELIAQKEGLAKMQEALLAEINKNPDINKDQLFEVAEKFAEDFKLTPEQLAVAKSILENYEKNHRLIKKIRSEYPDDKELYQVLFNRIPRGRVEVIEGSMMLYFRCHDAYDYAWIRAEKYHQVDDVLDSEDMKRAESSEAVYIPKVASMPELEGLITAENAQGKTFDTGEKATFVHEEQHVINNLIIQDLPKKTEVKTELLKNALKDKNEQKIKNLVKRHLRHLRRPFEEKAKDEILAFLKEGSSDKDVLFQLKLTEKEGGFYDYFKDLKTDEPKKIIEMLGDEQYSAVINDLSERAFKLEYEELIDRAVNSFMDLRRAGYTLDQTIALLITEHLWRWEKTAKRIIEQKEKVYPVK